MRGRGGCAAAVFACFEAAPPAGEPSTTVSRDSRRAVEHGFVQPPGRHGVSVEGLALLPRESPFSLRPAASVRLGGAARSSPEQARAPPGAPRLLRAPARSPPRSGRPRPPAARRARRGRSPGKRASGPAAPGRAARGTPPHAGGPPRSPACRPGCRTPPAPAGAAPARSRSSWSIFATCRSASASSGRVKRRSSVSRNPADSSQPSGVVGEGVEEEEGIDFALVAHGV